MPAQRAIPTTTKSGRTSRSATARRRRCKGWSNLDNSLTYFRHIVVLTMAPTSSWSFEK